MTFKEFKEKYNFYDATKCILRGFDPVYTNSEEVYANLKNALDNYCDGDEWFNTLIKAILSTYKFYKIEGGYNLEADFDYEDLLGIIEKGEYKIGIYDSPELANLTDTIDLESKDARTIFCSIIFADDMMLENFY